MGNGMTFEPQKNLNSCLIFLEAQARHDQTESGAEGEMALRKMKD